MIATTYLTSRQMILKTGWAEDPQQKMIQRLMLYGIPLSLLISGCAVPDRCDHLLGHEQPVLARPAAVGAAQVPAAADGRQDRPRDRPTDRAGRASRRRRPKGPAQPARSGGLVGRARTARPSRSSPVVDGKALRAEAGRQAGEPEEGRARQAPGRLTRPVARRTAPGTAALPAHATAPHRRARRSASTRRRRETSGPSRSGPSEYGDETVTDTSTPRADQSIDDETHAVAVDDVDRGRRTPTTRTARRPTTRTPESATRRATPTCSGRARSPPTTSRACSTSSTTTATSTSWCRPAGRWSRSSAAGCSRSSASAARRWRRCRS